uniref:Peptidase_M41 domain-containing protein n=1 Tax=Globodera pallida TaxID=36090 RepID=A0A183CBT5_GLOPA
MVLVAVDPVVMLFTSNDDRREARNTAFHEAGHAVAGYVLPNGMHLVGITIVPRGRHYLHGLRWRRRAMHFTGSAQGCESDEAKARSLAREVVLATPRRRMLSEAQFLGSDLIVADMANDDLCCNCTKLGNEEMTAAVIAKHAWRIKRLALALLDQ